MCTCNSPFGVSVKTVQPYVISSTFSALILSSTVTFCLFNAQPFAESCVKVAHIFPFNSSSFGLGLFRSRSTSVAVIFVPTLIVFPSIRLWSYCFSLRTRLYWFSMWPDYRRSFPDWHENHPFRHKDVSTQPFYQECAVNDDDVKGSASSRSEILALGNLVVALVVFTEISKGLFILAA